MFLAKDKKLSYSVKLTFLASLLCASSVLFFSQKQDLKHARRQCELISQTATRLFKTGLEQNLPINDNVEGMIMASDGKIMNFENLVASLINQFPAVLCVQLAPDGINSTAYPKIPDEDLIQNFFTFPKTKNTSRSAVINRKSYLTGPYTLSNGEEVLVIQDPVFLRNKKIQGEFWGFCVIYLKISNLFDKDILNYLNYSDPAYNFRLCKLNFADEREFLLAENTQKEFNNPCVTTFTIKESSMVLYTEPKNGWVDNSKIYLKLLFAFLFCFITTLVVGIVSHLKARDKNLEILSYKDSLTDLYNARKFKSVLKNLQKTAQEYTIVYLDLNEFKKINDTLGHAAGDKILIIATRKLSNCIREKDLAFRIGGDEFAIILHGNHDEMFIQAFIKRIKDSIKRETILQEGRMNVTTSAGYARCPQNGTDAELLVKMADKKMYEDKRRSQA